MSFLDVSLLVESLPNMSLVDVLVLSRILGADVCRTGEGCVELALDKVVKVESTEELSGEIFEVLVHEC